MMDGRDTPEPGGSNTHSTDAASIQSAHDTASCPRARWNVGNDSSSPRTRSGFRTSAQATK
ncbi:hypothetical protein [Archangium violaceum]|uniref:Uncharacterized protein n=1 Tax=Archangium violaceum Cb vi76 TaxID=1406225 RepID=A0A084SVT5_9BACT|nr:hypothetical protein [Archangium violaceum]KFA92570.1 hypothetical protein Q664_14445 [Archangium violaceum Cb vi76]